MAIFFLEPLDHSLTLLIADCQPVVVLELGKETDFLSGDSLYAAGRGI
jgi:hypothetical protein